MKKKLAVILILLCVLLLSACNGAGSGAAPALAEPIAASRDTAYAELRDIQQILILEAAVTPPSEPLSFTMPGFVGSVEVSLGDSVKKGDLLAKLDTERLESMRERLENDIAYQKAMHEIRTEQAEIMLAPMYGASYELARNEQDYASKLRLDQISSLEKQLDDCLEQIANAELTAPWDGTIIRINCTTGGYINENLPAMYIAKDDEALLRCEYMSNSYYENLISCRAIIGGNSYEVEFLPYERLEYLALVARNVKIQSRFNLICSDTTEIFGRYAVLEIIVAERKGVLALPNGTVQHDSDGYYVNLVHGERQIKTPVQIGLVSDVWTEITGGLNEGDEVYVIG